MITKKLLVYYCILSFAASANTFLVAPNSQTNAPGTEPNTLSGTNQNLRVQQVIGSGQFVPTPILINQIAFRAYPGLGPVNASISSMTLSVSTSQNFPNINGGKTIISTTFAANVGADNMVVYSGPGALTSPGCSGPSVCAFDMVIPFSHPFLFDPSQGALLLDFQFTGFTAVSGALDSVSFTYPPGGNAAAVVGQLNSPTGTFDPSGNVVQIGYSLPNPACSVGASVYPCAIAGTLLVVSAPTGTLFGGGGGGGGGATTAALIEDPQNPGFELTATPPVQSVGPGVGGLQSLSETFNFATVSGQQTITGGSASITCGVTGAAAYSLTLSATGPPLVLHCPSFSTPGTTANVTGQISFGPVSTLTATLTLTGTAATGNDTVSLGGFSIQIQIPSAAPFCAYGLGPAGIGFGPGGGNGKININTGANCAWSLFDIPSWVMPTTPTTGTGSGSVSYQVLANTGGDRAAIMSVTDTPFDIEQEAASIPGLTLIGSMAHLAAEENWTTMFTLVDKSASAAILRLTFFGDPMDPNGNNPLTLPLSFPQPAGAAVPQQAASPLLLVAASFDRTLAANGSLIVNTAGTQTPPVLVGSAHLTANAAVDGFAIFHQIVTTQEAVVPMETRNASSYLLAFDNTSELVLGVAVENVSPVNAVIPVVIRDENGVVISAPGASISVPGNGHLSFVLSDPVNGFAVTANIRGTVEFDTPAGGRISVLGLRFSPPNSALTTIPALANVGTGGGSIAHLASGGDGWQTTFVLVNTGASAAQATLSFFNDVTGSPLSLPLTFPQGGAPTMAPSVTQMLAAGATLVIVSGGVTPQLLTGSAQLTTAGHISGFVIFRHNNQEAVVPLESRNASGYIIAFDNTSGTATGIAVNAVSAGQVNVPVTVRDSTGATIATDTLTLNANGHTQFTLGIDKYPAALTIRGTIEFDTPAGAQIGALGIRIPNVPAHTYTTLPALAK